jgi:hypothetical protein
MSSFDWQPIETAPRLGSVLIYEPRQQWVTVGYQENGCWSDERAEDAPIFPSHWMPLPDAPMTPASKLDKAVGE